MLELLRGRSFQLWEYTPSHPRLLFRSSNAGDHATNVDIVFRGVEFVSGPTGLGAITLESASENETAEVHAAAGRDVGKVWALRGERATAFGAADVDVSENRFPPFASVFESRPPSSKWDMATGAPTPPLPMLVEARIEPCDTGERAVLGESLARLVAADLHREIVDDPASGGFLLRGQGDVIFDLDWWWRHDQQNFEVRVGAPRLLYRETIAQRIVIDETYQTADGRSHARLRFALEPRLRGTGASFEASHDAAIPDSGVAGIAKGVWMALAAGPRGWEVIDVAVILLEASWRERDESPETLEIVTVGEIGRALRDAGTVLLQPMMQVHLTAEEGYVGALKGDLVARGARLLDSEQSGNSITTVARGPLANLLGYAAGLKELCPGFSYHTMRFDGFDPVGPREPPRFRPAAALRVVG